MVWHSLKDILSKFDLASPSGGSNSGKYVSREFQAFGCYLAEQLNDLNHKSLYIKLAKTEDRRLLENALQYVQDSHARSKPRLFMWKIKQLKQTKTPKETTGNTSDVRGAPREDTSEVSRGDKS